MPDTVFNHKATSLASTIPCYSASYEIDAETSAYTSSPAYTSSEYRETTTITQAEPVLARETTTITYPPETTTETTTTTITYPPEVTTTTTVFEPETEVVTTAFAYPETTTEFAYPLTETRFAYPETTAFAYPETTAFAYPEMQTTTTTETETFLAPTSYVLDATVSKPVQAAAYSLGGLHTDVFRSLNDPVIWVTDSMAKQRQRLALIDEQILMAGAKVDVLRFHATARGATRGDKHLYKKAMRDHKKICAHRNKVVRKL
jgi:hypothetical protein